MTWSKLSIKQGVGLLDALSSESADIDNEFRALAIIHGKPESYFENLPRWRVLELIAKTKWINTLPAAKSMKAFSSGLYVYKFRTLPEQLSKSDFVMLQKLGQSSHENLHKILAVLSTKYNRITGKQIIGNDYEARSELFLNKMPFSTAFAYTLFFSTYYPTLLRVGLAYSQGTKEAIQSHLKTL